MSNVLMGVIATPGRIEATYRYTVFGATKTAVKKTDWPEEVQTAAAALLSVCDSEAGAVGTVVQVQTYTAITDPVGYPGFSAPGECLDITFQPGNSPAGVRVGDDEVVPTAIATARDALAAAIEAAL